MAPLDTTVAKSCDMECGKRKSWEESATVCEENDFVLEVRQNRKRSRSVKFNEEVRVMVEDVDLESTLDFPFAYKATTAATLLRDGPALEVLNFDLLITAFVKRTVTNAQDVATLFKGAPVSTIFEICRTSIPRAIRIIEEKGRVALLPSTSTLTEQMIPHLLRLKEMCETALELVASDLFESAKLAVGERLTGFGDDVSEQVEIGVKC